MLIEIKSVGGRGLYSAENAQDVRAALVEATKARANLSGADLSGAYLSGADLSGAYLSGADLSGANLSGANLSGADLSGAYLSGAYLSEAYLSEAYLSGAYLSGAYLRGADLSGAYLSGAYLSGAYLSGANLRGANLSGANLRGANLSGAKGFNPLHVNDLLILLDQPGPIRAYKLVTRLGWGPFNGGIQYEVGKSYSVENAGCDPTTQCGAGINLATLPWCIRAWRVGYRILVVEFTAEDVAAIPVGDGKFRVHRCRVVGEKDLVELGLVKPAAGMAA